MKFQQIIHLLLFLFIISPIILIGQNLPDEINLSEDGRQLITGNTDVTGLYNESKVRTIRLNFSQTDYWQQLENGAEILANLQVDDDSFSDVAVRFKGNTTLDGALNSDKKSFKITIDEVLDGQDVRGYSTLNLHNAYQDPSSIREVFYANALRKHIPGVKASFIQLFINGQDWGLYTNIQQLNGDFLNEWFLSNDGTRWQADQLDDENWGDGTAAMNYLGMDTSTYQQYYDLKKANKPNPWEDLVTTTFALNEMPLSNLEEELPNYLDVDRTLWFLAYEILFADEDSYIFKGKTDYYLYWEVETGRMTPLEVDGNNVMNPNNVGWSPFYNEENENYPLLNRLLSIPTYRQRYLAHLRTLLEEVFEPSFAATQIDEYISEIDSFVQFDPKPLYEYSDFLNEIQILKDFHQVRYDFLQSNSEINQIAPTISAVSLMVNGEEWAGVTADDEVQIQATISHSAGISKAHLYYAPDFVGAFDKVIMYDDGTNEDSIAGDGIFTGTIPAFSNETWVRYYVEAIANDNAQSQSYLPKGAEHNTFIYQVGLIQSGDREISINELVASNSNVGNDENGEFDDWIELHNLTNSTIDLSGYFLSDNFDNLDKWEVPSGVTIPANGYLIIWADEDGSQGDTHANFKLSAAGESVFLVSPDLQVIDQVTYTNLNTDQAYARIPNGTGTFVKQTPTFAANNEDAVSTTFVHELDSSLTVFPNPATSFIYVVAKNQTAFTFEIVNSLGQKILTKEGHFTYKIDTSQWEAGLYFVVYNGHAQAIIIGQ